VKSAWEVGEASNPKEASGGGWDAWAPGSSRANASGPSVGQYGSGFGYHDDFSRGRNGNKLINHKTKLKKNCKLSFYA
jgi:hypothetical protein